MDLRHGSSKLANLIHGTNQLNLLFKSCLVLELNETEGKIRSSESLYKNIISC